MNRVAILQSNYLPWKGVFDLINRVDTFVFLEDVQYNEHDWRNRNKIVTNCGIKWITVPVKNSGKFGQLICEAEIDNRVNWQRKHFNAFQMNYGRASYFKEFSWILEEIYLNNKWTSLSELNMFSTKLIAEILGIRTAFVNSLKIDKQGTKDDRVIEICRSLNADYYLSGPSAKAYINPKKFLDNGIDLAYMRYEYPPYKQMKEPFENYVTILDLIFNCGNQAPYYIWGWQNRY